MSNETSEKNDVFSTVEETTEKQIKSAEKSFPNYQASVTSKENLQTRLESTQLFQKQQKTLYANQMNRLVRCKMFKTR